MKKVILVALVSLLAIASVGSAVSPLFPEWIGPAGGNWATAANWDANVAGVPQNAVPTTADTATFADVSTEAVVTTAQSVGNLNMGVAAGATSNLRVANGGTLNVLGQTVVSYNAGCAANLTVDAGGILNNTFNWLYVGQWGTGKLTVKGTVVAFGTGWNASGSGTTSNALIDIKGGLYRTDAVSYGAPNTVGGFVAISDGGKFQGKIAGGFSVAAAQAWINAGLITGFGLQVSTVTVGGVQYAQILAPITTVWDNQTSNGLWTTALNWNSDTVPSGSSDVSFADVNSLCTINADVYANSITLGKTAAKISALTIASGGYAHLDYNPAGAVVVSGVVGSGGILTVQAGGSMDVGGVLTVAQAGTGTIIMNGGQVTCSTLKFTGSETSRASIQLNDGTLIVNTNVSIASQYATLNVDLKKGSCYIAFASGVFDLAAAQAWVDRGYFTGYGQMGNVNFVVVNVGGYDYVKFTAKCSLISTDGNLNSDCVIDLKDFAVFASNWLKTGN